MVNFVFYAFVSLALIALTMFWARCHAADTQAAVALLDEAYEASQSLVKEQSTPDSVVNFTEFFASQMGRPALARGFAWHLLTGAHRSQLSERTKRLSTDLHALDPKGMDNFSRMIACGMLASAAADPFLSRVYPNAVKMFLSTSGDKSDVTVSPERARTVAVDVAESGFGDCLPQAA